MAELKKTFSVGAGIATLKTAAGVALPLAPFQEVTLDRSWTTKEIPNGDMQMSAGTIITDKKVTGKAKVDAMYGSLLAALVDGTITVGGVDRASETTTIGAGHTVTVANAADFVGDLGVILPSGKLGKKVASAPQAGEYSVAAGVYTFNASDTGAPTFMYSWTNDALVTVVESNKASGAPNTLELTVFNSNKGVRNIVLPSITITKVGEGMKVKDVASWDVDFTVNPDANGDVVKTALDS